MNMRGKSRTEQMERERRQIKRIMWTTGVLCCGEPMCIVGETAESIEWFCTECHSHFKQGVR